MTSPTRKEIFGAAVLNVAETFAIWRDLRGKRRPTDPCVQSASRRFPCSEGSAEYLPVGPASKRGIHERNGLAVYNCNTLFD